MTGTVDHKHGRAWGRRRPRQIGPGGRRHGISDGMRALIGPFAGVRFTRTIDHGTLNPSLGWSGSLEVRLATTWREVRRTQALRYRVFYREMSAQQNMRQFLLRRDADRFDAICDHLLVIDHDPDPAIARHRRGPIVVGTYRLLRQDVAERHNGFYTQDEFDIAPLIRRKAGQRFLELGRSCVLKPYRTKRTVELLWGGIWSYLTHYDVDVLIGCASLEGNDPDKLALELSFVHHFAQPAGDWSARALPSRYVEMNRMPREAIDPKKALRKLPPLVKGYLRLGASFGEGAVIDHQFGTTDVCVIAPIQQLDMRYINHVKLDADTEPAE